MQLGHLIKLWIAPNYQNRAPDPQTSQLCHSCCSRWAASALRPLFHTSHVLRKVLRVEPRIEAGADTARCKKKQYQLRALLAGDQSLRSCGAMDHLNLLNPTFELSDTLCRAKDGIMLDPDGASSCGYLFHASAFQIYLMPCSMQRIFCSVFQLLNFPGSGQVK